MGCTVSRLDKMLPGYQDWVKKRRGRVTQGGGSIIQPIGVGSRPPSQLIVDPAAGVLSYSQMRRVGGGGNKPPSEVGSIRSFRSVQTIEEQVDRLEGDVEGLKKAQQETNTKLDQIISLLAAQDTRKTDPNPAPEEINKKKRGY